MQQPPNVKIQKRNSGNECNEFEHPENSHTDQTETNEIEQNEI